MKGIILENIKPHACLRALCVFMCSLKSYSLPMDALFYINK